MAEAVIRVLLRRGLALSDAEKETILSTQDLATLENWLDRAVVVESTAELFDER